MKILCSTLLLLYCFFQIRCDAFAQSEKDASVQAGTGIYGHSSLTSVQNFPKKSGSRITLPPCEQLNLPETMHLCAGDSIQLQADLSAFDSYISLQWTGGEGSFFPSDTVAQPVYFPSPSEIASGMVALTLQVVTEAFEQAGGSFLAYDHNGEDMIFYTNTIDGAVDVIQDNTGNDWTAMGYRVANNTLYGISNIVTTPTLSSVNLETGLVTPIYTFPGEQFYAGDYDNVSELFYVIGMTENAGGQNVDQFLYTVDINTGALTTIGNLNLPAPDDFFYAGDDGINGLAYDPSLNILWATTTNGALLEIDPANASINSTMSTVDGLRGLAYDYNTNELWGINTTATLYHINKFTGEIIEEVACQQLLFYVTSLTYALQPDAAGNACTDTVMLIIDDNPAIDLGNDAGFCAGETVNLSVPGFAAYAWQDGSTASSYTVDEGGSYSVTVTDLNGCMASDTIELAMSEIPVASINANPMVASVNDTEINFMVSDASGNLSYTWSFEEGTPESSQSSNGVVTFPPVPGTYEVNLIVVNEFGCADTATTSIQITGDTSITMPSIFTPNGDGDNDYFIPFEDFPGPWELTIYNRWGNIIYETSNVLQGWNGGEHASATYYWILQPRDERQGASKSGYVMLIRE